MLELQWRNAFPPAQSLSFLQVSPQAALDDSSLWQGEVSPFPLALSEEQAEATAARNNQAKVATDVAGLVFNTRI
jgi:uroporphyrinogen-III decarboxylase